MKQILQLAFAVVISFGACATVYAQDCYGSANNRTCTASDGSSYTTQRIGSYSHTDGYNSKTGSSWSSSTQRVGNTSFTNGTDSHGNSWNETTQHVGNTTYQSGTDSRGNTFSSQTQSNGSGADDTDDDGN